MDKRSITILPALAILLLLSGCGSDNNTDTQTPQNIAPTVDAGVDVSINQGESFSPTPIYSDSDGTIASAVWTYNGATITFPKTDFGIGEHILILSVMDDDGAVTTDEVKVTVNADVVAFKSLLKTGQTESYHNNDDGDLQKGTSRSYSRDEINEIVTDNVTGLLWQDNEETKTQMMNFDQANEYCQKLTLGGFNDWRVPSIEELASLVNKGKNEPSIDINNAPNEAFEKIVSEEYWSSTIYSDGRDRTAWTLDFSNGSSSGGYNLKTDNYNIRCVK